MVIRFLALLLVCQLAGESITVWLELQVPGPVIGMAILFAGLMIRRGVPATLGEVSGSLLRHLSLLFVPAGVGVMLHAGRLADQWPAVVVALVVSAVATIAVTALLMNRLGRGTEAES